MTGYKAACCKLRQDIADTEQRCRDEMEAHFQNKDTRSIWQGLHEITDYKVAHSCMVGADETLANELNSFYVRFKASNANASNANASNANASNAKAGHANAGLINTDRRSSTSEAALSPVFSEHDARKELKRVNTRKAAGPDRISE